MSVKVKFNKANTNPFSVMPSTLILYQNTSKTINTLMLDKAYSECDTEEKVALLFSILFSIGDIPRQHRIFGGKVDSGGISARENFRDIAIPWMWKKVKSMPNASEFIWLVYQYTSADNILATRVRTTKGKTKIEQIINMVSVFGVDHVVDFMARLYYSENAADKMALSKFMTLPQSRKGQQKDTLSLRDIRIQLLSKFSDKVGLPYSTEGFPNFYGFRKWRKEFNSNFESVLFTTGKIMDLDRESFLRLLQMTPSAARFRIKKKVFGNEKYSKQKEYYEYFEKFKETKQQEARVLEEKIRQGDSSERNLAKLEKLKRQAKVNTGGTTIRNVIMDFLAGKIQDEVQIFSVLEKIKLEYNTLVFIDDSGSMSSQYSSRWPFSARSFAAAMATLCMAKNPDPSARNIVGLFSSSCRIFTAIDIVETAPNRLMRGPAKQVDKPLYDPTKPFLENVSNFTGFLNRHSTMQGTNVASIAHEIRKWIKEDPYAIDQLAKYPVWTLISDGNFNNLGGAASSLGQLFNELDQIIGFRPVVLLIDVADNTSQPIVNFTGMEGIFAVPPTPENLELILTNLSDMDTVDVYMPLNSFYRSDRYLPVRNFIMETLTDSTKSSARKRADVVGV